MTYFTKIYVFGDSYSDTGNAYNLTEGVLAAPPNRNRGFSNGCLWVDYLASKLELNFTLSTGTLQLNTGINFAVAGATTGDSNLFPEIIPDLPPLPGLQQQIDLFTTVLKQTKEDADGSALYIIWAGAADYAPFVNGIPKYTEPSTSISNISQAAKTLLEVGAKNILLVNLIDMGKKPLASAVNDITPKGTVSAAVLAHNEALSELTRALDLMLFDAKSVIDCAIAHPEKFGFSNTTSACCAVSSFDPEEYLFWDQVHLTRKANEMLAIAALQTIPPPKRGGS